MTHMKDPMNDAQRYLDIVASQIRQVRETQWSSIQTAGQWIADALAGDHWFYTFGTGHSRMLAEEVFHRAGGLARAIPFLDPMVYFTAGAEAATAFERLRRTNDSASVSVSRRKAPANRVQPSCLLLVS